MSLIRFPLNLPPVAKPKRPDWIDRLFLTVLMAAIIGVLILAAALLEP